MPITAVDFADENVEIFFPHVSVIEISISIFRRFRRSKRGSMCIAYFTKYELPSLRVATLAIRRRITKKGT